MQYKEVAGGICAPKGFAAAGVHCGIRANHSEKYDLALIKAEVRCAAAGVYTTNKVCGAPIKVDRAHLADGYAQAIVVNSGNANPCAANGVALAEECCALVGKALNIDAKDVLPASTGVIGQPMGIDPFAWWRYPDPRSSGYRCRAHRPRRQPQRGLLQPVQGGGLWPRCQLGPHPLRHGLFRRGV